MRRFVNRRPGRVLGSFLAAVPFAVLLTIYVLASNARLAANPDDKLLPSFASFWNAIVRMGFEPSKRTGEYLLWVDTLASLERLCLGVGMAASIALVLGLTL